MNFSKFEWVLIILLVCGIFWNIGTYLYDGFSYKSEFRKLSHEYIELSRLHNKLSRFINTGDVK